MFYIIGESYIFGFGQAQFPRKVPGRNGLKCAIKVGVGREGVDELPGKVSGIIV